MCDITSTSKNNRVPFSTFAGNFRRNVLAPPPAACIALRPSDKLGLIHTAGVAATTIAGLAMSRLGGIRWFGGQLLLAVSLVQWFILLHECGHETLFRRGPLNTLVGGVAAFFSGIPFICWKRVHGKHHRWTGWQDLDPTTASLVPRPLSAMERSVIHISWKYWIPTFSVLYRVNNYWNLLRLRKLFGPSREWRQMASGAIGLLSLYSITIYLMGIRGVIEMGGLAVFLALVCEDPLILSQHTHIPQHVSHGVNARPFAALEQEEFTRSLLFPAWVSKFVLFNFDAHELHHMYPFVPGYCLRRIPYDGMNEIHWWRWLTLAKRIRGEEFLFRNQNDTGIYI